MSSRMKQNIKRVLTQIYFPIYQMNKFLDQRPKFTILMYHSVNPTHGRSIHPKTFEEQINFLMRNYRVKPLENFLLFDEDSVAITFDDGYEDNFHYVLPILKKYNLTATFFICTGFVSKEIDITKNGAYQGLKPLSLDQMREMKKEGMNFGCHTHTHPILSKIPLEEAKREIHKSKVILEDILEEKINLFAYPLGQPKTFNKNIISILKEEGFQLACSTIWGSNNKRINPLILRRIRIDSEDTLKDFQNKIEGNWDFVHFFQGFKRLI